MFYLFEFVILSFGIKVWHPYCCDNMKSQIVPMKDPIKGGSFGMALLTTRLNNYKKL